MKHLIFALLVVVFSFSSTSSEGAWGWLSCLSRLLPESPAAFYERVRYETETGVDHDVMSLLVPEPLRTDAQAAAYAASVSHGRAATLFGFLAHDFVLNPLSAELRMRTLWQGKEPPRYARISENTRLVLLVIRHYVERYPSPERNTAFSVVENFLDRAAADLPDPVRAAALDCLVTLALLEKESNPDLLQRAVQHVIEPSVKGFDYRAWERPVGNLDALVFASIAKREAP